MGWTNSHLYEIRLRDIGWGRPDPYAGRCPPEDVGGPSGYREFLDAIANPNHQEHAETLQWIGGQFDPTNADTETLAQAVHSLAKKWSRKPSARKRR